MRNEPIEVIQKYGFDIHIYRDDSDCHNPREWDNVGTMVCKHRFYLLGDEQMECDPIDWLASMLGLEEEQVHSIAEKLGVSYYSNEVLADLEGRFFDQYIGHKLYLYDHGGITMATRPFGCRWDSGQVGYIYCTKERAVEEWGNKRCTEAVVEKALEYLNHEVETYDQYITGQVYGYTTMIGDEEIDSCWGFYGSDHEASGLMDHATECIPDAKDVWERGDMKTCEFDGNKLKKIYAYALQCFYTEPYKSAFEIVEDLDTGEVEFKVLV